jgi:hypothetical protein
MNDRDLEELISRLPRPSPSPELDSRIDELARRTRPPRTTAVGWQILLPLGSAVCAGLLGFVLGRQSVLAKTADPLIRETQSRAVEKSLFPQGKSSRSSPAPKPIFVEAPASQAFVSFVMPPKRRLNPFGERSLEKPNVPKSLD